MAFIKLITTASKLGKLKQELVEEKIDAVKISKKEPVKRKCRHRLIRLRLKAKRLLKKALSCFFFEKFCYTVRHDGTCENFTLKSIVGFISGFILTYMFFMFFMFQLNFTLTTATIFCSILGCVLMLGLAFSTKVRCVVLLTLPQLFSQKGRQALLAYAMILTVSGPARNMLNNLGILSESLACGQEQLKQAVRQIIDVIKKPFLAIKDAIKKVIKTVKEIVKTIKDILLKIKRVIMAILKVIKAAFEFLAKIINICNKELGTPFERCTRVFENAVADCSAKLGPLFSWLCSLTYIVQSVCYLVKFLDLICMIVDFISDSIIGVVIRKVKTFVRHIRTMFYVRIRFSHTFQFQTNSSKTMAEVTQAMMGEIKQRTEVIRAIFKFMTSAATIFFLFLIIKVTYYRFKFLTSEKFDNKYINKDFREIDMRRAKLGKETVLPLNDREMQVYVSVGSSKLGKLEKKALSKAISSLATASLKMAIFMAGDYCLFWILNLIKYYGKFQSKVQAPNMPTVHIKGNGLLADLLRSIVNAFQPAGIYLEIDTIPCLPTGIPPDYDRYVQIGTLIILCWVLTLLEPYGLRLRHMVMCYYHPLRAKQRAIWLYNHIMRARNSFLKLARRQLRRKVLGDGSIAKITFKEYLAANFRICALCLGDNLQECCLLCGEVFRESDNKKPIRCRTPDCPGTYCEQCFSDLQNLCTICLSPIEYGDLSDISEEKDSSEEEPRTIVPKEIKKNKWKRCFLCSKCFDRCFPDREEKEETRKSKPWFGKKDSEDDSSDEEGKLLKEPDLSVPDLKDDDLNKTKDSDYYSSDNSTDYSYSYQYEKTYDSQPAPVVTSFKDVEKQEVPDYASMSSFREDADESDLQPKTMLDKGTATTTKRSTGTSISGTTLQEFKRGRKVDFTGVSDTAKVTVRKKKKKKKRKMPKIAEERPLLYSSDSEDTDRLQHLQSPVLNLLGSPSSSFADLQPTYPSSSEDNDESFPASPIGAEIRRDIRHAQMLIPHLNLSEVPQAYVPEDITVTSSSLDSEIKGNHELVKLMVPELDLSSLTSTPRSYVSDIFGNVKFDEISESPKSSSSSRQRSSSPEDSQEKKYAKPHQSAVKVDKGVPVSKVDKGVPAMSKTKVDAATSTSAKPVDRYKFEEKQRKKVKQYYKAVKDIPYRRGKVEDRRKSGKFMKLVQKIIPKRKQNPDVLPFYSKDGREEFELKTSKYSQNYFDTPTSTTLHSAIIRQRGTTSRKRNTSSEEEKEERDRVRGGTSGLIRDFHHSLSRCESTSPSETDSTSLTDFPRYSKPHAIRKELLARYFVSIEDLTPTRDSDIPMTAVEPHETCGCTQGEVPIRELPEKDTVKQDPGKPKQPSATHVDATGNTSKHSIQTSSHNLPATDASEHGIKTSSSSNLSESLCTSILGAPCSIAEFKSNSATSKNPNLQSKDSKSAGQQNKEARKTSVHSKEPTVKRESLSVIPEAEAVSAEKPKPPPTEEASKATKDSRGGGDQHNLPAKVASTCLSKYCNCESIEHKDGVTQTCPSSILKNCRVKTSLTTIKSSVSNLSLHSQNIVVDTGTDTVAMDRAVSRTDKIVETMEKYPVKESATDPRTALTSEKNLQTSNDTIYSLSGGSRIDDSSKIVQLSQSSSSYCGCQSNQSRQSHQSQHSHHSQPTHQNIQSHQGGQSRHGHEMSHSSCKYSCCKCPPPPPNFEDFVNVRNVDHRTTARGHGPRYHEHPKYISETASDCSVRSPQRRPSLPMRRYMEFPSDSGYSLQESQYRSSIDTYEAPHRRVERPQSRQKPENVIRCNCKGDCRSCTKRKPSPRVPLPPQYRPMKYDSSTSSEPEDEEEEDDVESNDYYENPQQNRHDLPYQSSEDYMDLVQELEETLQSRNRNRVRRAMQEFERRSRYNKPLEKPIIDYDETSESEEPIIQRISQLTSEKQMCCGGPARMCTCRRDARPRGSLEKKNLPMQRIKKKMAPASRGDESKTRWQMDMNSGEWYKVSGSQQRHKGLRRPATASPRRPCHHDCSCCVSKGYDYR